VTAAAADFREARAMRPRTVVSAVVLLAVLPLIAACSGPPSDPIAAARRLDGAPGWVRMPTGIDCGQGSLDGRGGAPTETLRCLERAAHDGRRANAAWVLWTTEGDPTPTFVRIDHKTVEVASTAAYDSYGGGGWSSATCADARALPDCR
jgi:hypothetical protein